MVIFHKWFILNCVKKKIVPGVCSEDKRGKHCTRPGKISEDMKDAVREHIDYFACIESLLQERNIKKILVTCNQC